MSDEVAYKIEEEKHRVGELEHVEYFIRRNDEFWAGPFDLKKKAEIWLRESKELGFS